MVEAMLRGGKPVLALHGVRGEFFINKEVIQISSDVIFNTGFYAA